MADEIDAVIVRLNGPWHEGDPSSADVDVLIAAYREKAAEVERLYAQVDSDARVAAASKAFYNLTVQQRDSAWREVERLEAENERLMEQGHFFGKKAERRGYSRCTADVVAWLDAERAKAYPDAHTDARLSYNVEVAYQIARQVEHGEHEGAAGAAEKEQADG